MKAFLIRSFRHPVVPGLLLGAVAFIVYVQTLLPGIGFIDSGELVSVVHSLGIAHPTGYPLFTLLGWVFSRLPIGPDEAYRLNMMAALFCSASLVIFFLVARRLLAGLAERLGSREELIVPAAAGGMLFLAFSRTFWMQALAVEVYSLHMLLTAIVLVLVFGARARGSHAGWVVAAYALGLSFTNHMTTVLLVPGVLYVYWTSMPSAKEVLRGLLRLFPPFLLGLSVYLYLPLRASVPPEHNWGDPSNWERFFWHLSGKQYRVWIFSSAEAAMKQLALFFRTIPGEFVVVGLLLALIGLVALWMKSRQIATATMLLFVVCVGYAINYDISDIESYFLLAYVCVSVWAGAGLLVIGTWWVRSGGWAVSVASVLMVGVGLVPCVVHYDDVDESSNHLVDDYTYNMFASLQPGALVMSYQWDFWVSASYYVQGVRRERTDVLVIDKELLRRSWYLDELDRRVPEFMARCGPEVGAFRKELFKFEYGLPYDGSVIEARFVGMIRAMLAKGMEDRPVYVTPEIEGEFTAGWVRVPEGLAFRVVGDTAFHPTPFPDFRVRGLAREGRLEDVVWRMYGNAYLARGDYYFVHGLAEEAKRSYNSGVSVDPSSIQLRSRLTGLQ